jgi:hypothetical protein
MTTTYILTTNGTDHTVTYTNKAKAIEAAQVYVWGAQESNQGEHHISVRTQKTGKVIFEETVTHLARTVEIQGEYVEAEDVHAHMAEQTAWMTQEGVCMGLCAVGTGCTHCDEQYGEIEPQTGIESVHDVSGVVLQTRQKSACGHWTGLLSPEGVCTRCPNVSEMITEILESEGEDYVYDSMTETVCVIQNIPGTNGNMHYHTPGCRDIAREAKRHGQSENDVFAGGFLSAADILSHEYGDVCNGDAEGIVAEANSEYFGVRVMPCLDIPLGELNGIPLAIRNGEFILAPTEVREEGCEHGAINGPCCDIENDVPMIEMEFYLSVDIEPGVTVDLGWHTFNGGVPATWDNALIADLYGTRHGSGNPKGGWSSIIRVIDFAAL